MSVMLDVTTHPVVDTPPQDVVSAVDPAPMPCSRISDGWVVVHSYPQAEAWAQANLTRRGYHVYLPLMAVRRRDRVIRSLWHTVDVPLFPRYLFVAYPGNWTPIRYCPGVYRIVSAAGKPNLASNAAISALQAAQDARRCPAAEEPEWAPGTPVAVSGGVFDGMPGIVLKVGNNMALVSMMMLGHLREIAVSFDCLRTRSE